MIIQINATVCAAIDHGDDRQHKIAGSDPRKRCTRTWERAGDQEKVEISACGIDAVSSREDTGTIAAAQAAGGLGKVAVLSSLDHAGAGPRCCRNLAAIG
jgi:hypothetical protein